jgi:hypothetical protein
MRIRTTALLLILAAIAGCGKSSNEKRLEAAYAEAQAEIGTLKDELARLKVDFESQTDKCSQLSNVNETLRKETFPPNLIIAMDVAKKHFELVENGRFTFTKTKDPSDGSRIQGIDPLDTTILQITKDPDGVTTEALLAVMMSPDLRKIQRDRVVKHVRDFRDTFALQIPLEEYSEFFGATCDFNKKGLSIVRRWDGVEAVGTKGEIAGVPVVTITLTAIR